MTDYEDMKRGTAREWAAARAVLIGGFVIAIAVACYFTWAQHKAAEEHAAQVAALEQQQEQAIAQARANASQQNSQAATERAGLALCLLELNDAKQMGIIPQFGKLAALMPRATERQGRYACAAQTDVSKYIIIGDLMCKNLGDQKCIALESIKSDDGTVLYQRKD